MPRLPPVDMSPHTRLRATFCPGVGYSVVTFDQSHSSSSATSCARPVSVPWPISERAIRITQVLSGFTETHALISVPVFASAAPMNGMFIPSARPPAVEVTRNWRREGLFKERFFMSALLVAGGEMHGRADPLIRPAAADIGHRLVDLRVGRFRILLEQRRGGHDLARLAVAALRHVERRPGL